MFGRKKTIRVVIDGIEEIVDEQFVKDIIRERNCAREYRDKVKDMLRDKMDEISSLKDRLDRANQKLAMYGYLGEL